MDISERIFKNFRNVRKLRRTLKRVIDNGTPYDDAARIEEVFDRYLCECKTDEEESELWVKLENIKNHLMEFDENIDIGNINILDYSSFYEMASRIPRDKTGRSSLIIAVGDNERNLAHFHVFRNEEDLHAWKNSACIYFTENKYFDHNGHREILTRKEIDEMINILNNIHTGGSMTNWEWLVSVWNANNDRYEIPYDLKMPEYNYDTIKRYKEK